MAVAFSAALAGGEASSDSWGGRPGVLWYDQEGERRVLFVPEDVLQEIGFDRLPIGEQAREWLDEKLRRAADRRAGNPDPDERPPCDGFIIGCMGDYCPAIDWPPPERMVESVERLPVAFLGTVLRATAGLTLHDARAATLVWVRVDEVFRSDVPVAEGDVLTYLQEIAHLETPSGELCVENESFHAARAGDRVVVGGAADPENPGNLTAGRDAVFPVVDGRLIPPRYCEARPRSLESVRRSAAAAARFR